MLRLQLWLQLSRYLLIAIMVGSSKRLHAADPLMLRSMAPLVLQRLSYTPNSTEVVSPGTWSMTVAFAHANIWADMPYYFWDGEWTRLSLRHRWGLPHRLELGLQMEIHSRSGGYFDTLIMDFHQFLHLTQSRRDRFPRNQLRVASLDTERLSVNDVGTGMIDPVVLLRQNLWHVGVRRPGASWELGLTIPIGDRRRHFAYGAISAMLGIVIELPLHPQITLLAAMGLVMTPAPVPVWRIPQASWQRYNAVALIWQWHAYMAVVLQYLSQDGSAEGLRFAPLNQSTHEFALGLQIALAAHRQQLLELAIIENSVHDANTPDVGFHLSWTTHFGRGW